MPEGNEKKQIDIATLESEFANFLEEKGYDLSAVPEQELEVEVNRDSDVPTKQKPIRTISEKLNEREWNFDIYTDTRRIVPGLVVYIIEQVAPTIKIPYVTYKPAPRIITEIQDNSGVNNGAVFFTYSHKITEPAPAYNSEKTPRQVVSVSEVIYSPLTKDHAEYICKLLNLQSKQFYVKNIKNVAQQNMMQR